MLTVKNTIAPYDANSRLPVRSNPQLPVLYKGNNPGNVQLKSAPSRFSGLTDTVKGAAGKLKMGPATGFVTGLTALNMLGQESAETLAENPEVQASWTKFKNSSYLDPEAMPDIHDEYLSEDARQAIMQMAPAANALNLRKNQLDLLNGLANVAEEERAMQNATESLLANASDNVANIVNDSRDPGTQAYLAQQVKNDIPNTKTISTTGTGGSGNALDSLMGLLGLLALGGGAYYLGRRR